ncbi:MAG: 23S rRNA (pseudouridine(1915)-N(3))-methyltransferase RlmH [Capsulimonadales bacterium]|nr:23S rRNA (pseudouridine(1915)-N(3))-methyltransferase RlmH [Capsulimonadales bacterium]
MAGKPSFHLLAVGRLRERYWVEAQAEYRKRLSGYSSALTVTEVADESTPDNASDAQETAIRNREGDRLLAAIGPRDFIVALDRQGQRMDSPQFAAFLERKMVQDGVSAFTFVIGGSLGLSEALLSEADLTLSFGDFTFPHQMMRILLLEQLYRAARIARNEPYHK